MNAILDMVGIVLFRFLRDLNCPAFPQPDDKENDKNHEEDKEPKKGGFILKI